MPWNQHADWSGSDFFIEGTTSNRPIVVCSGDNINMPPLMGRINAEIVTSTSAACFNLTNPTTQTLWIEKLVVEIATAGSSSCFMSVGLVSVAGSSTCTDMTGASSVVCSTLSGVAPFYTMRGSSLAFPVAWTTATFVAGWMTAYTTGAARAVTGDVSVFYVNAVTT